jgi:cytochrome bd ubiquinol oxidase subunit II
MVIDYPFIWAGLIAFAVLAYVILDGFDLGIGILFPFFKDAKNRDVMMNTVAPVWDGNETWLVLGGGGLLAVFPLAYAIIMPALYAPIIVMLLALIFRGVAFEFRWKTKRAKYLWDWAFAGGSIVATFAQGVALGALVQGIKVADRAYAGGWWDWLTPFSLMTGIALLCGYALLGACWLIYKTQGELQDKAFQAAKITGIATLLLIAIVSVWTPFLNPIFMDRWLRFPQILYTSPVPLLVLASAWLLFTGIATRRDLQPFLAALAFFVLSYIGLGISLYPYIVPHSVTIWQAAGPDNSLKFLLAGTLVLVPLILAYTAWSYWVFRGKVTEESGYH